MFIEIEFRHGNVENERIDHENRFLETKKTTVSWTLFGLKSYLKIKFREFYILRE